MQKSLMYMGNNTSLLEARSLAKSLLGKDKNILQQTKQNNAA